MAFEQFEIKVRKAFGNMIRPRQKDVWIDPNHETGTRFCARATSPEGIPLFITCNPITGTFTVYKGKNDPTPTIIKA